MSPTQPTLPTTPDFVMTEVKLLLGPLTTPETNVSFNTQSRANSNTIENSIGRLPEVAWTWTDKDARAQQPLYESDIGRYGLQTDSQKVYRLVSISPALWQPIQDFTIATWTWRNQTARLAEVVEVGDVGKVGYQADIDSYFRLDNLTGPVWTQAANPNVTSGPFEVSTGASDAVSFHDFYRLQIAFEDVWAELIDKSIGTTAEAFYAKWDALMNAGMSSDINDQQYSAQFDALSSALEGVQAAVSGVVPNVLISAGQIAALSGVRTLLTTSISTVAQVQGNASDAFKNAFGLDMQNLQANLQLALSGLGALVSGGIADGTTLAMVANALGAALKIVTNLKDELSQDAAARTAVFNATVVGDIGGYDELENFLNDARIILGLPTIAPPAASADSQMGDYTTFFDKAFRGLKGARDYLDSLVFAIKPAGANNGGLAVSPQQAQYLASSITSNLIDAQLNIAGLQTSPSQAFLQNYGSDLNAVSDYLKQASAALQTFVQTLVNGSLSPGYIDATPPPPLPSGITVTSPNVISLLDSAETTLHDIKSRYVQAISDASGDNSDNFATDRNFPEVETLFKELSDMLKERYRFDIFAPASINYGLLLNYRQKWEPQSYQVGNLAATIPLAPGETRKYATKKVVKKSRNAKELNDSLYSNKVDQSQTQRDDAEIFTDANQRTDFSANASGSFKIGVYDVHADTHLGANQGVASKNTKRDMHESVLKSAQEYRDQHRLEVTTDESREYEMTNSREIRNPNDELTVTYLFYELQRRYLVSESLYRATPVILVANDVPAPHEIDEAWLVRHDWILKRVILDDSFLPALTYLGSEFAGQETALIILELQVQHQKAIVDQLSGQVKLANQALNAATAGVTNAEDWSLNDQRNKEYGSFVKGFFDPLGIGKAGSVDDGNSDRARIDFANEALQRTQAKVNDLTSQMKTELTALQAAVDKYTAAATRHYSMEAQIDRLRLHVKDNIIYYMQAIWSHEPADQRYFRLYNLDVPVFESDGTVTAKSLTVQPGGTAHAKAILSTAGTNHKTFTGKFPKPALSNDTKKLHQVADVDNLIGFKGNYMIFPLTDFDNYMAWYLIHNYVELDPTAGLVVSDPDPNSDAKPADLEAAMEAILAQDQTSFAQYETQFEEVMLRLLSDQTEQMVIVPSGQLYIEALPGTHPILEDFKLIHRALDVKKVQAEVRHAELENLRLAARLASGEYGDPDIDKVVVVGKGQNVTVDAGG
jgi:hypothetical protein